MLWSSAARCQWAGLSGCSARPSGTGASQTSSTCSSLSAAGNAPPFLADQCPPCWLVLRAHTSAAIAVLIGTAFGRGTRAELLVEGTVDTAVEEAGPVAAAPPKAAPLAAALGDSSAAPGAAKPADAACHDACLPDDPPLRPAAAAWLRAASYDPGGAVSLLARLLNPAPGSSQARAPTHIPCTNTHRPLAPTAY